MFDTIDLAAILGLLDPPVFAALPNEGSTQLLRRRNAGVRKALGTGINSLEDVDMEDVEVGGGDGGGGGELINGDLLKI
jgi:hypothetical protein